MNHPKRTAALDRNGWRLPRGLNFLLGKNDDMEGVEDCDNLRLEGFQKQTNF